MPDPVSDSLWWYRLYPAFMLMLPAAVSLFVKPHPTLAKQGHDGLTLRLWAVTLLFMALHIVVQGLFEAGTLDRGGLMNGWSVTYPLLGFFVLWFGFAGPALAARNPGWRGRTPAEQPVRTVSLVPRDRDPVLPAGPWIAAWTAYAVCVAATGWVVVTSLNPFPVFGILFFPGFAWGARMVRSEPQPLDAAGSDDLRQAYESLSRFMVWGFLIGGLAGTAVFTGAGILMVLAPAQAGLVGGLGGCLVGLAGGVFGTLGSVKRARIQRLLAERAAGEGTERPAGDVGSEAASR